MFWIVKDAFVYFVVVMHIIQRVISYPMVVAQFAENKITCNSKQMDIEKFLELRPEWAQSPALYIVRQMATENPGAHRCGASGTFLVPNQVDLDVPYRSDSAIFKGLLGRMVMYQNYWLPIRGSLIAALRIKRALVAEPQQRTGEDSQGNTYNITRGNQTLVLTREKEFHQVLDSRGYRWQKDRRNELFQAPAKELIASLRQIRGEELYLFSKDSITQDPHYRGGSRKERITITETQPRQQPQRETRAPSLTITLSRSALEQLRSGSPQQFERLLNLVRSFDEDRKNTTTVTAPKEVVQEMRQDTDRGRQILDAVVAQQPTRRSPRLAELNDRSTEAIETTIEVPRLRRSARLAQKLNFLG